MTVRCASKRWMTPHSKSQPSSRSRSQNVFCVRIERVLSCYRMCSVFHSIHILCVCSCVCVQNTREIRYTRTCPPLHPPHPYPHTHVCATGRAAVGDRHISRCGKTGCSCTCWAQTSSPRHGSCMRLCACVCACVCACMCACVCACVHAHRARERKKRVREQEVWW